MSALDLRLSACLIKRDGEQPSLHLPRSLGRTIPLYRFLLDVPICEFSIPCAESENDRRKRSKWHAYAAIQHSRLSFSFSCRAARRRMIMGILEDASGEKMKLSADLTDPSTRMLRSNVPWRSLVGRSSSSCSNAAAGDGPRERGVDSRTKPYVVTRNISASSSPDGPRQPAPRTGGMDRGWMVLSVHGKGRKMLFFFFQSCMLLPSSS
jgi:hypothetical protein